MRRLVLLLVGPGMRGVKTAYGRRRRSRMRWKRGRGSGIKVGLVGSAERMQWFWVMLVFASVYILGNGVQELDRSTKAYAHVTAEAASI